ncbi:site-specific integrase [Cupriavidus sp. AU9028]|uniref:site-specific integrase n=1 Tax=Cupriavidus sp. AU9028 TaxID=2871157 RepID=UPI001C97C92E|nr:site-specific integrase [Cupriavidus sp. AU9028]MBY4896868.1 site-specific integrase [Cupriavidus sp. AU9028]
MRDDTIAAGKLTRTEFAVVRAYAQGMPAVEIANRYLLDPDDDEVLTEHQAVQRILTLRDRLVQFALQNDRPDIAAMFDSLKGRSNVAMDRRVDALSSLERLAPAQPALEHAVSLWFRPSLALRLSSAGLPRIEDLVRLINRRGTAWWREVPRLGRKSAAVVAGWLRDHRPGLHRRQPSGQQQADPGLRLDSLIGAPLRPGDWPRLHAMPLDHRLPCPVPLEQMVPSRLAAGDRPGMPAGSADYAGALAEELRLVAQWLETVRGKPNTWASYRREAERLLLWSAVSRRSLRSLRPADIDAYLRFLADPQPAAFWQGPSGARDRVHWRPFQGGLSPSSRQAARRVLHVLFNALHRCGWIASNPCLGRVRRSSAESALLQRHPSGQQGGPGDGQHDTLMAAADSVLLGRFADWLRHEARAGRLRAANAAVQLAARFGLGAEELVSLRGSDLPSLLSPPDPAADEGPSGATALDALRHALQMHWEDRGVAGALPADYPVLGPERLPPTPRAKAKLAELGDARLARYSRGGMEALLRRAWEAFAAQPEHPVPVGWRFTPRKLAQAGGAPRVAPPAGQQAEREASADADGCAVGGTAA